MAIVHCSKCGITGESKNPATRNTFLFDQSLAELEMIVPCTIEDDRLHISTFVYEGDTLEQTYERVIRILQRVLEKGQAKAFCCNHTFVLSNPADAERAEMYR